MDKDPRPSSFFLKKMQFFQTLLGVCLGGPGGLSGCLGASLALKRPSVVKQGVFPDARFRLRSAFGQLRPELAEFCRAEALKKRV